MNVGSSTGESKLYTRRCSVREANNATTVVMLSRNAGGNIRFAVRDILLLDTAFSITELVIVHHTDCGSLQFTNDGLREAVKSRVDKAHWDEIEDINWGANTE
jgi:carbonic anhydrase